MLRIMWIDPVASKGINEKIRKTINEVKSPDVEPTIVYIKEGPTHVEYHFYEHLNMHGTLKWVKKAEKEGYDAVVIGCFYDPGLREARELVKIPVIGVAESSMHIAATLGHKFSILVGRRKWIPKMESNIQIYGLEKKLASFRVLNFTVPRMLEEPDRLRESIKREAQKAIDEDGAEVIVLGCTVESGFMKELIEALGVPVIDAVVASWKYEEMMADLYRKMNLVHSKLFGYESPPEENGFLKKLE